MRLNFYFTILLILICRISFAQTKEEKQEAAYHFEQKNYRLAYALYDKLYTASPKNVEYKFRLGYCALYYPEKKARAIEIFEDIKRTDKEPEADYYLAKSYHVNYKFDDAILFYNTFIEAKNKKSKPADAAFIEDAQLGIVNCNNGKLLLTKKVFADIKNLGMPPNTEEHQYVPVISADESILIYTYVGKNTTGGKVNDLLKADNEDGYYHEDIYISRKTTDSTFGEGVSISSVINTKGHDAAIALSPDGNMLFTYTSTEKDNGDIYTSTLTGEEWSKPERLNANINTEEWEGSCSITADGRYLYFASERLGGIGGRDLYVSEKINGDWGPATNLGPEINTIYDEDAPFIHPDGITLFFSSKGHLSIGGYDIMYSIKKENHWIEPLSMGIPLNTTEDDRYYVINAGGDVGYFSSNRGDSGGKGGQDIYTVTPGILGEKPILALLRGNVFADDKPVEAKIEIVKKAGSEKIGPYYSNSKTGRYLMALTPGSSYEITITINLPGFEPIKEDLDVEKLQKFIEVKKDFYVYSESYANKKTQKSVKSILDSLLGVTAPVDDFKYDAVTNNGSSQVAKDPEVVKNNASANNGKSSSPKETKTTKNDATSNSNSTPVTESKETKTTKPAKTVKNNGITKDDEEVVAISTIAETPCEEGSMPDVTSFKGKSLNDISVYKNLLDVAGNVCRKGLVFKVQIAAFKNPENYKYNHLKSFGAPEIVEYPDGITRFTQLQFSTLKQAEQARQKIINKGQSDAWLVAFVDGKRFTLEELIMVDFLIKSVN